MIARAALPADASPRSPSDAARRAPLASLRARLSFLALLALLAGCHTAPPAAFQRGTPLPVDDPRATRVIDDYLARVAQREVLRGSARVDVTGPDFKLNRPQNIVVARPARLRFEVIGLFEQLAAVIVSDGESYGFYDASSGEMEAGPLTDGLLWELAKVDVGVPEAVALLLGAPRPQAFGARAAVWQEESDRLGIAFTTFPVRRRAASCGDVPERGWRDAACFAERRALEAGGDAFVFDRGGRLVELRAFLPDGVLRYRARFEQYAVLGEGDAQTDFPRVVTIESPEVGSQARFAWKRVVLGGEVADRLFRLPEKGTRW